MKTWHQAPAIIYPTYKMWPHWMMSAILPIYFIWKLPWNHPCHGNRNIPEWNIQAENCRLLEKILCCPEIRAIIKQQLYIFDSALQSLSDMLTISLLMSRGTTNVLCLGVSQEADGTDMTKQNDWREKRNKLSSCTFFGEDLCLTPQRHY